MSRDPIRRFLSKRFLILTALVSLTAFAIGTVLSQVVPKAKSWLLITVDTFSRDHLPMRILPGKVEFRFLPLGVTLIDVRILPGRSLEGIVAPLAIQEVTADFSILQIVRGDVSLDEVQIKGASVHVNIPPLPSSGGKPLEGLFKALDRLPIASVQLEEINLELNLTKQKFSIDAEKLRVHASRTRGSLIASLSAESILLTDHNEKRALRISPDLSLRATRKLLQFEKVEIRRGRSTLNLSGELKGDTEGLAFDEGRLEGGTDLDVKSTRDWLQKSVKEAEPTPPMSGHLTSAFSATKANRIAPWKATYSANTEDFRVEGILLDRVALAGTWDGRGAHIPQLTSKSRASDFVISEIKIGEGAEKTPEGRTPWLMRIGKLKANALEVHEFLTDMGVGPIPVWMSAQGEFPCESQLVPKFIIRCGGEMQAQNMVVQGDLKSGRTHVGSIAAIPLFNAKGDFSFDLEKFQYKAEMHLPRSSGRSSGEVRYKSGFDIQYDVEKLAIADLASLGSLKLAGSMKFKGSTKGNSKAAVFSMDAEGQDFWLEDFWLGQPKTLISYKSGVLSFNSLQGYYSTSRYNGDVVVNLKDSTIDTQIRVPFFDARDLLKVFSKKFTLPFALSGTGQASVKASGPLALGKLTYDLKSSLFKGRIAGENFDQVHFDVKAKAGEVRSERVSVSHGNALIQLTGVGHPNGHIETDVRGRGINIEETNLISESGIALTGLVGFDMKLTGPVLAPDAEMAGTLTRTTIAESNMPDSDFLLRFTSRTIEGKGRFLGDLLNANFVFPLQPEAPFSLQFQSHDWNYAPVFAAIAGPNGRRDYEGRLTSDINLKGPRGGIWGATGTARIDKLSLRRGSIELANTRPIVVAFKEGQASIRDFEVNGEGTFIKIANREGADAPSNKLDVTLNSKIDLNLLSIFTPFFEEMRGLLSMAVTLKMGPGTSDIIGSAFIDRAYIKFPEFQHAFENLQSDLLFNHRKIVINSVKSDFASGKIQAAGGLEFKEHHVVPVNVTGTFDKITLNIPEKIKTSGSGDFSVTGNWFPFLLKGNYLIKDGLMTKEFGGPDAGDTGFKRDQFLPRFLLEESFQPLALDLKIDAVNGIQVKNEMVNGAAAGKLHVEGIPTKPKIEGQIRTLNETKVTFRENIFDVSSAIVTFDDPNEVNPKINLNARTRVDTYDVNLIVQGTAKKPELSVSSVPPMSERDIYSLLALGITDQKLSEGVSGQQQGNAAGQQVLSGVANQLLKEPSKAIGLDVQLSTAMDGGTEAYQKVTVQKRINKKLGVSGSRGLTKAGQTEAKMQYRITDRVSGVVSYQTVDRSEATDSSGQAVRNSDKWGLDFEYKFEFK